MEQIYDSLPCSTLRVSLETEGNGQSHPFAPWPEYKKRSRREHLRLRFLLHFLAIYSTAFFHFLIFVRNVPKGAAVLTWINL